MKILRWLDDNFEEVILITLLVAITVIMGVQVVARYVFNNSFTWSEELVRYMFIYTGFISVSYCTKKWISIKINQVIDLFPTRIYTFLQLLLNCILCIFYCYLSFHSYLYLLSSIDSGQLSPALRIPMYFVQAAPLIGFSLASVRSFQQILLDSKKLYHYLTGTGEKGDEDVC